MDGDQVKKVGPNPDLASIYQMLLMQQTSIDGLSKNMDQMLDVINGDPTRDLPGLRVRVKDAEAIIEDWKRYKLIVKGIAIGMGLTMVTSISTLITLISQVVKVTP